MTSNKTALKSGIWYTISNFLLKGIGFITTPIFTRLLTKAEFGAFNNYTSWLSIVSIFATLNLTATLISAKQDFKDKIDEYILSMLALSTSITSVFLICVNIFDGFFEELFGLNILYINVMLVYLLFLPFVDMFLTRTSYYFEYKKSVITSLLLSLSTAIVSVLLVSNLSNKLTGRIVGSALFTIVFGFGFAFYFAKKGKQINFSYWKYAIPICLPYIPHILSMTLLNSTDRIMIERMCGSEATAMYSLAYSCGAIITTLLTSLNSAFAPWLGEKLADSRINEIKSFSKIYILVFLAFAVATMLISPEVLWVLGGTNYMEAKFVMPPVIMGCVCQFLYTMFVNVEQYMKKTVGMAIASAIAAFVNLLLNYIFIQRFGYLAAAYTTLVGYLCLLVIHMCLVKRLHLDNVYSYKFISFVVLAGIVTMLAVTFLYRNNLIRYFCIMVVCVAAITLLFIFKDRIKTLTQNFRRNDHV